MTDPKTIDENAVINPSSGIFARNPSHVVEAEEAEDQREIVEAIRGTGTAAQVMAIKYEYANIDLKNPPPLAGITKIREMSEEDTITFCKNLMRTRPNILKAHIKLGNYPSQTPIVNQRTRLLNTNKPRWHTEVGEKIGQVLGDKSLWVTEIIYSITNTEPGLFNVSTRVYGVDKKAYSDNKFFAPSIEISFIKTT